MRPPLVVKALPLALALVACSTEPAPLALRERDGQPAFEQLAPTVGGPKPTASATSTALACVAAVKPPAGLGTMRVKVRSYTADRSNVRFFLEPRGAGKAPFEAESNSGGLSLLLVNAFESQRELEVALEAGTCVPEVVFVRTP